ncbi:MAG: hypothetical protein JWN37_832 [Candidatus Nomurabacteria bacterium]|nr:hypothetical protein [Candidatus Nomurabacteria bacterium]
MICGGVVVVLILVGVITSKKAATFKEIVPTGIVSFDAGTLDGNYVWDSQSPYSNSTVNISSSTDEMVHYYIMTENFDHFGNLESNAYRDTSTTSLVYVSSDFYRGQNQEGCKVIIMFNGSFSLTYEAQDMPVHIPDEDFDATCEQYHGAQGEFFNDKLHIRDGGVTLPSIVDLGFTREDRNQFEKLIENSMSIDGYIGKESEGDTFTRKLNVKDIPGAMGYSMEAPNPYSGVSCEYAVGKFDPGMCDYVGFIKSPNNNYFLLTVNSENGGRMFVYKTTASQWKNKIPQSLIDDLKRLGYKESDVELLP